MAEFALVDYFIMGEAIGIVATLVVSFYYSRKQMQKLSVDIESKVLSDMDEKVNDLTRLTIEKPQLMRVVSNVDSYQSEEIAFTYHLLQTFAHVYDMFYSDFPLSSSSYLQLLGLLPLTLQYHNKRLESIYSLL